MNLLVVDWDYAAGFIDADGTVTLERYWTKRGVRAAMPLICIDQKRGEVVLPALQRLFGAGRIKANAAVSRLILRGAVALPVARELALRLVVKRRQAEMLLEFAACRELNARVVPDEHCAMLDDELRLLNARGKSGQHNMNLTRLGSSR